MSDYKPKTYEEFCVLKSIEEKESLMVLKHNAERRSMERLTKRNEANTAYYYPKCFEKCDGLGASEKCNNCDLVHDACEKLGEYEDLEEQGLMLKLPCKVGDTVYSLDRFCGGYSLDCPCDNITVKVIRLIVNPLYTA